LAFANLSAVASETTTMPKEVTCQSDSDCVVVYRCVDQAIAKALAPAFQVSPDCQKSAPHNPAAVARCVQGACTVVVPTSGTSSSAAPQASIATLDQAHCPCWHGVQHKCLPREACE
jgi:hypothetical protein